MTMDEAAEGAFCDAARADAPVVVVVVVVGRHCEYQGFPTVHVDPLSQHVKPVHP